MKFLWGHKDGGPESNVRCWGLEFKRLGSIMVLHFAPGSREAFHSHAFNAVSWVLTGDLMEDVPTKVVDCGDHSHQAYHIYAPTWRPVITRRATFHKVHGGAYGAWVFSLRGRWHKTWQDGQPGATDTLTHGRAVVPQVCPECGQSDMERHMSHCGHRPGYGEQP
jgi:hypothetical protein